MFKLKVKTFFHWTSLWLCLGLAEFLSAEPAVRIPPSVGQDLTQLRQRFLLVLDEECPMEKCHPVGCKIESFDTLDEDQDSSLPGLESQGKVQKQLQYRLSAASCEFTYEPDLEDKFVTSLKQRLNQRVRQSGVSLNIVPRKLAAKILQEEVVPPAPEKREDVKKEESIDAKYANWSDGLRYAFLPFLPWFMLLIVIVLSLMLMLWAHRRLGLKRDSRLRTRADDILNPLSLNSADGEAHENGLSAIEPNSSLFLQRIAQIKARLEEDPTLFEIAFKPIFEQKNYLDLCLFLKHFDPQHFNVFKEKSEYRSVLETLSHKFADFNQPVPVQEIWAFFDRLERLLTGAQIRIPHEPLADEFAFLASLSVTELIELLQDASDMEAVAAITYAPKPLQEKFFGAAPPSVVAKLVAKLTTVDRMSDSFARQTARKLKQFYREKGDELQSIKVNPSPLLESAFNHLSQADRKKIVSELGRDKPGLMENLLPSLFLDETLLSITPELLTEIFLEIGPQEAAMYLAHVEGGRQVLERLNPRISTNLKKFLDLAKDEDVIMQVREKIAAFLRKKDLEGLVDLKAITLSLIR